MRDFLKYTFASLLGLLIFLGLSVGGLVGLVILLALRSDTGPRVADKSVLVFDLSVNITDSRPNSSTRQVVSEALSGDDNETLTLRTVLNTLDQATKDKRIVGLYLYGSIDGNGPGAGFAALKEVREALQRFRAAGKTIVAYDVNWREREYYLASVANTIAINPSGSFEFNGLQSELTFFANALQKYGIGVQVTRVGKYKSAVEPFLLTQRSPANREQTEKLLRDLWGEFLKTTSKERKLTSKQLQQIADTQGILLPEEAKKSGLVDRLAYTDEMLAELKRLTGQGDKDRSFRQISLKTYTRVAENELEKANNPSRQVAVVYAEGDIVSGQGGVREVGGDRLARTLRDVRQNDSIKAVVLRVNSPGGSASASDVIQREVILTRKVKPLVVSMGSVAASGGYWIATYGDRIFAEPNTITGSIGVFGLLPNVQNLSNNLGITWDVVKTGRYADINTVARPKTPEELALIQRAVDKIYDEFISKVAESRKLPKQRVAEIAQGRVWSGAEAKRLGLVDELGGLEAAVQEAAKRANLGKDWQLEEYPRSRSLEERLFKRLAGDEASSKPPADPLTAQYEKFQQDLAALRALNDPRGIYLRLPFDLRID